MRSPHASRVISVPRVTRAVGCASVGAKCIVRVRRDYAEPTNVFLAVALPPATRKSAAFRHANAPLFEAERRDDEQRRDAAAAGDEGPPSPPLRLFVGDATSEAVSHHMAEQGGQLGVLTAEGGELFAQIAGRYSDAPNLGVYLKGHAGDPIRVDRIKRKSEYIPDPALTVCVATQPSTLRTLASRPELRGRGLPARFLFSVPRSNVGFRDVEPPTMDPATRAAYHRLIEQLLALPFDVDAEGRACAHELALAAGAADLYRAFAAKTETRLREGADLAKMAEWGGKLVGATLRVAGLLHLADHAGDAEPWAHPIDADTLERSINLSEAYWVTHARIAFGLMTDTDNVEAARRLLAWLHAPLRDGSRRTEFSVRDAHRALDRNGKREEVVDPALEVLTDHGYIRVLETETTNPKGGRPRGARYRVHPELL